MRSSDLETYFNGNPDAWFLDDVYAQHVEQFRSLGVSCAVRVFCRERNGRHIIIADWRGRHESGLDGFDPDCEIDGLKHALLHITYAKALYVWNNILPSNIHHIRGVVESRRYHYEQPTRNEKLSKMGSLVCKISWIPHKSLEFHRTCELSVNDLPEEFKRDEWLAKQLGMKSTSLVTLAKEIGIELEDIEYIRDNLGVFKEFKEWRAQQGNTPFPIETSGNPEFRRARVAEQAATATEKTFEQRPRSVRTSDDETRAEAKAYLRERYTNDGKMLCQICTREMPFKLDNGTYYFEAVECVKDTGKEHSQNYLALCPLCAAKYRYANSSSPEVIRSAVLHTENLEIPIALALETHTLHFVAVHLSDLKVVLETH